MQVYVSPTALERLVEASVQNIVRFDTVSFTTGSAQATFHCLVAHYGPGRFETCCWSRYNERIKTEKPSRMDFGCQYVVHDFPEGGVACTR